MTGAWLVFFRAMLHCGVKCPLFPIRLDPSIMIQVVRADLSNPLHQDGLVACLDAYALEPMGRGTGLSAAVRQRLVDDLRRQSSNVNFLALQGGAVIGAAVCFMGYSTFRAQPRLNVHDLAVLPAHRGKGFGRMLLDKVAEYARAQNCCAVSLEVRTDNAVAQTLYRNQGFGQTDNPMEFWLKSL